MEALAKEEFVLSHREKGASLEEAHSPKDQLLTQTITEGSYKCLINGHINFMALKGSEHILKISES